MTRKDFFAKVGFGAAMVLVPACIAGLETSCSKDNAATGGTTPSGGGVPISFPFTVDVSSGSLATAGGFMVTNGVVIARTLAGDFIAVAAACTHQGTNVNYVASTNNFKCPNHGSQFSSGGVVQVGPAASNLKQYQTALTGTALKISE